MELNRSISVVETESCGAPDMSNHISTDAEFLRDAAESRDREGAKARVSKKTEMLIATTGRGMNLTEAPLSELNLSGFDLRRANLNRAQLYGTNLQGADLRESSMVCAGMERTNFKKANLSRSYVHALAAQVCDFSEADLSNLVDATGTLFHGCKLIKTALNGAVLNGVSFYQCDLSNASLSGAQLQGGLINECYVENTGFQKSLLDETSIIKCYLRGSDFSGASGKNASFVRLTNAQGINLAHVNMPFVRFADFCAKDWICEDACLSGATLSNVVFFSLDARDAQLTSSNWNNCQLIESSLEGAKLSEGSWNKVVAPGLNLTQASAENMRMIECSVIRGIFRNFAGRCFSARDCDFSESDFENAYMYRASLTGDPPKAMSLRNASLRGANIVQAYLAADFSGADLTAVTGAYARLNQSDFSGASLAGAGFFQASCVKTDFTGSILSAFKVPFFPSRCPGLHEALASASEPSSGTIAFVRAFEKVLVSAKGGST
jgi:uncharacterized protein YjbI with pentapeptide repeats